MDSRCAYCKYFMNNMCKGKDKIFPCDIWKKHDDRKTTFPEFMTWHFRGSHLIPKTTREWFKLTINIIFLIFFVFMITNMVFFYNDGYAVGYSVCQNQMLANMTEAMKNFTGSGMMSP